MEAGVAVDARKPLVGVAAGDDLTVATVALALLDQIVIQRRLKPLVRNGADIVAGRFERLACRVSQVFVELELQAASSIGIGTKRSRAISDP